jgi:hypothetical protein
VKFKYTEKISTLTKKTSHTSHECKNEGVTDTTVSHTTLGLKERRDSASTMAGASTTSERRKRYELKAFRVAFTRSSIRIYAYGYAPCQAHTHTHTLFWRERDNFSKDTCFLSPFSFPPHLEILCTFHTVARLMTRQARTAGDTWLPYCYEPVCTSNQTHRSFRNACVLVHA